MEYTQIKRIVDIILSLFLILVLFPIMLIEAIFILITSGGPVLFKPRRPGKNCKLFIMYKFRSMKNNWLELYGKGAKLEDVVTPIGMFIREFHIDEFPQLFNVLKGDMSLVGPRPLEEVHHTKIYCSIVKSIKPGLISLNNVLRYMHEHRRKKIIKKFENKKYFETQRRIERFYSENISFLLDLKILYWTLFMEFDILINYIRNLFFK